MAWPVTLPHPLAAGYSFKKMAGTKRVKMDVGADRVRRITQQGPTTFSVSWRITDAQYKIFRDFWQEVKGVDSFDVSLWVSASPATVSARFVGPYELARVGGNKYIISATLETFNPPMIVEGTLDARLA